MRRWVDELVVLVVVGRRMLPSRARGRHGKRVFRRVDILMVGVLREVELVWLVRWEDGWVSKLVGERRLKVRWG